MLLKRCFLACAACAAAGCEKVEGWLPTFREKEAIERAVDAVSGVEPESSAEPRASAELQAFRHHVESTGKVLAGELASVSGRLAAVQADSDSLAKAMASAAGGKSAAGAPVGRKDALLSLLGDGDVNALARRYLGRSFSLVALEAGQKIGEAEERELRCRREASDSAAEAKAIVDSAMAESRRARESAMEGVRRLKQELDGLRRRKGRLENELNMVAAADRGRVRQEIRDLQGQILKMEREYDGLRASSALNREVQRSGEQERRIRDAVDSRRSRTASGRSGADSAAAPGDIASEYERTTVLALEKAIADELSAVSARRDRISRAAEYVKSRGEVRQSLSHAALQAIRADIDARVAAALNDIK